MLGKETKRRLAPQKRGPKKKADRSENQETFSLVLSRSFVPIEPIVHPSLA
jgi:hypothetical protein